MREKVPMETTFIVMKYFILISVKVLTNCDFKSFSWKLLITIDNFLKLSCTPLTRQFIDG